ncbi:hypothetical protein QWY84_04805 [Aquisalimonas lutea]|nr:hypothetical protein [Aquisalimonas lutea]MDN3516928.1 hypothetical protein [Aquisalimonas lutea]
MTTEATRRNTALGTSTFGVTAVSLAWIAWAEWRPGARPVTASGAESR